MNKKSLAYSRVRVLPPEQGSTLRLKAKALQWLQKLLCTRRAMSLHIKQLVVLRPLMSLVSRVSVRHSPICVTCLALISGAPDPHRTTDICRRIKVQRIKILESTITIFRFRLFLGQLVATGSHDSSIKILDVERMLAKSVSPADHLGQETPQQQMETHPVIRTLYDHTAEVTCVDFHPDPTLQILVSGSKDYTIKLFDFSNPSVKKAQRNIPEASPIRTLHFHPSGNFLLVGTQHKTLRLYDVQTCRCYVSAVPEDQHQSAVNMVRWSPNGNAYVTAGMDGSFKIWDGVSCRCVNTFEAAHDGAPVCSVMFSRNGKYILSSGKDSAVKLWELATGRCLITYTGAGTTGHQTHRSMAVFNHTEDYVLFPDEATKSLCCWDSRNADRQRLLALNHNGPIRCFVHSPTTAAFMSCSDDNRARFWYKRPISD
ncbi:Cleavage stimulation factor subunit [Fasciola hepatica]|uniref:Cleavage stimulation factor 50 kDa subunit n=1 Tax=Fasciola hepatica TaxID=6192 RepID=A0A4E0R2P9_FASHE|nr:Cleavage stimulation factor subunit [Fasciola hepatica]